MTVTLYSLPPTKCVKCHATEISMRRKNIAVHKVRLDEDPEAMEYVKSLGYSQAPVVVVEDNGTVIDHWGDFREERIAALKNAA